MTAAALRARSRLGDPIEAVAKLAPRALLVIAPVEDRLISWRQSLALYEAAGEPKELFVVPGAGHGDAYVDRSRRVPASGCSASSAGTSRRPERRRPRTIGAWMHPFLCL